MPLSLRSWKIKFFFGLHHRLNRFIVDTKSPDLRQAECAFAGDCYAHLVPFILCNLKAWNIVAVRNRKNCKRILMTLTGKSKRKTFCSVLIIQCCMMQRCHFEFLTTWSVKIILTAKQIEYWFFIFLPFIQSFAYFELFSCN